MEAPPLVFSQCGRKGAKRRFRTRASTRPPRSSRLLRAPEHQARHRINGGPAAAAVAEHLYSSASLATGLHMLKKRFQSVTLLPLLISECEIRCRVSAIKWSIIFLSCREVGPNKNNTNMHHAIKIKIELLLKKNVICYNSFGIKYL